MTQHRISSVVAALAIVLWASIPVHAQAPLRVQPADAAYADLDRMATAGLIDVARLGQRAYTRRLVAMLTAQARARAVQLGDGAVAPAVREALDRLDRRVHSDLADGGTTTGIVAGVDELTLAFTQSGAMWRPAPADTGLGGVDGIVAPLALTGAQGRDAIRGSSVSIEASAWIRVGAHVAFEARPRLRASGASSVLGEQPVAWRALVGRFQAQNVVISVGRDYLRWGFARHGGLFFSDNAPPLDLVSVASDLPFTLPGPFARLGPATATAFATDLGARQFFPHTLLLGYALNVAPTPRLQLGVSVFDFTGGHGSPRATALKRVEHFILFPVLPLKGFQFSNQMAGVDLQYTWRGQRAATVYWEMNLDDFDVRRLDGVLWRDDAAQLFGVRVPSVTADGRVGVTAEFHHTGTRFGRHLQFRSGATRDQLLLGEALGPDADGGYLFLDWDPAEDMHLALSVAGEAYRADEFSIASQDPFVIRQFASRPQERRTRMIASWRQQAAASRVWFVVQAGIEHITRFAFADGPARTSGLASATLHWALR